MPALRLWFFKAIIWAKASSISALCCRPCSLLSSSSAPSTSMSNASSREITTSSSSSSSSAAGVLFLLFLEFLAGGADFAAVLALLAGVGSSSTSISSFDSSSEPTSLPSFSASLPSPSSSPSCSPCWRDSSASPATTETIELITSTLREEPWMAQAHCQTFFTPSRRPRVDWFCSAFSDNSSSDRSNSCISAPDCASPSSLPSSFSSSSSFSEALSEGGNSSAGTMETKPSNTWVSESFDTSAWNKVCTINALSASFSRPACATVLVSSDTLCTAAGLCENSS
mmetsp:Transcript_10113/g.17557  ORF Transcript_10113/g.17557 Transcript_10113/m.17557 type:complete len:284 (-) Transcript_10113:2094-2945(-)